MKRIFLFSIFCTLSVCGLAKGMAGKYTITGIAYSKGKTALSDTTLTMLFNGKTTIVPTDSAGNFTLKIKWATACRSGRTKEQCEEITKKINPKYIVVNFGDTSVTLKNKWKKYSEYGRHRTKTVRNKNLYFK